MRVTSMKGQAVDLGRYLAQNENAIAIGNGQMNSRGDQLGRGGAIVKSRDETSREYYEGRGDKTVHKVAVNRLSDEVFGGMTTASKKIDDVRETTVFQSPADVVAESDRRSSEAREARKKKIEEANKDEE